MGRVLTRTISAHAVAALVVLAATSTAFAEDPFDETVRSDHTFAGERLAATAGAIATTSYPYYTNSLGAWKTTSASSWTSGFFPGSLWLEYQQTFDTAWRSRAESRQAGIESQKYNTSTHDLGFMVLNSFGNGYRLTGNDAYRQVVLQAARSLATRYSPAVGAIRSWNTSPSTFRVIVDGMMNLELLFWAARNGGDPAWRDIAVRHALKTRENHVRSDGSTYHVVDYDPTTGAVQRRSTVQGYTAESTWSRGQAWALHGFTIAYRETGDPRFLETARRTADYFVSNLPADKVPYWDFQAPGIPNEPRDSSAAAIAASGLLELSRLETDATRRLSYLGEAKEMLTSLSSPAYLSRGTTNSAVLLHGTQNKPAGNSDTGLIWGDYYFMEGLLRYRLIKPSTPPLPVSAVRASSSDGNGPANTLDNNLSTRWSSSGSGQWIRFDLGATRTVSKIAVAFYLGDRRTYRFKVQTSTDAVHWSTISSTISSGRTLGQETFDVADRQARYVRLVGYGSSATGWNNVTEVDVH
jgi:unsaturated chondroitin disaccharide hydrolase